MATYDNKLGEWFKQVEKQEQEFKAKKTATGVPYRVQDDPEPAVKIERSVDAVSIQSPVREAPMATVATVEPDEISANVGIIEETRPEPISSDSPNPAPALFEEQEIPQLDDFLSFLSRSAGTEVLPLEEDVRRFDVPRKQATLNLSEGTGEPRPITPEPAFEAPAPTEHIIAAPVAEPILRLIDQPEPVDSSVLQEKWDRVPHHLQTLFGSESEEVAQHSYKTFRETRGELIQRLLDPTISLEEAARVLDVCPTTVRRYTNRGVLPHFRTAGNQRRFRLSDVLSFMEKE